MQDFERARRLVLSIPNGKANVESVSVQRNDVLSLERDPVHNDMPSNFDGTQYAVIGDESGQCHRAFALAIEAEQWMEEYRRIGQQSDDNLNYEWANAKRGLPTNGIHFTVLDPAYTRLLEEEYDRRWS